MTRQTLDEYLNLWRQQSIGETTVSSRPWTDYCLSFPALEDYIARRALLDVSALEHVRTCRYCRVRLYTLAEDAGLTKEVIDRQMVQEWRTALRLVGVSFRDALSEEIGSLLAQYAPGNPALLRTLVRQACASGLHDASWEDYRHSQVYAFCTHLGQPVRYTTNKPQRTRKPTDEPAHARLMPPLVHQLFQEEDVFSTISGREWLNMDSSPFLQRSPVVSQAFTRALVSQMQFAVGYKEFEAFQGAPIGDVLRLPR